MFTIYMEWRERDIIARGLGLANQILDYKFHSSGAIIAIKQRCRSRSELVKVNNNNNIISTDVVSC